MNQKLPTIYSCSVVELPKVSDRRGNLTAIHGSENIPFYIARVFYLYDIPGGESRGAHAHRKCHQFLIAASGSFEVMLDDGSNRRTVRIDRPYLGVHIPPGIWAAEQSFSSGAICLVFASHKYDQQDYIRNYNNYLQFRSAEFEMAGEK